MRADEPNLAGHIVRDGVKVAYEVFGMDGPTLVLLPCWIIVHARSWKAQIADLAQDYRLVVVEGRGNGASDRPVEASDYSYVAFVEDALAVMDHLAVGACTLLGFSKGAVQAAMIAQRRPEQIQGIVLIGPVGPKTPAERAAAEARFLKERPHYEGWAKYNAAYFHRDCAGFVRFFFERMFCERHSTKQIEDAIDWASQTTAKVLEASVLGDLRDDSDVAAAYASIGCPVLLIQGEADEIAPLEAARHVAALCRAEMMVIPGAGHGPHLRFPAAVNEAIRRFLARSAVAAAEPARRRGRRAPRALYLSSPIGLGHARRDIAIARALRTSRPGMTVDWLAQDPVTRVLGRAGERLHPASARLASESRHIEEEAGEHDLNVFQALRRMDEILVHNFRVFQDVIEAGDYDVIVADEGWEVDHFWHEHPNLKRARLAWLTDFVGFAAMAEGGAAEAALTADYNAEMVDHVEGHPGIRDLAVFVGNPDDVVDDSLGPALPERRAWVAERFSFSGYVLGDEIPAPGDKARLREELGWRTDEKVCVVTVGGSGVGEALIRRIMAAARLAGRALAELRTVVVTGPRLNPAAFQAPPTVEVRGFEPELPKMLAACDLALVQGGLSTCMELTACQTPFIYFPLRRHFEQNIHVPQRLAAYGAGRRLDFGAADAETIAAAMLAEIGGHGRYRPVERDGAARAARLIAELL
jgi:pimeloyl-ACP methyl ester carboxylesterase/predicted glycosyltransferase